jgi:cell wall-associated NlpC family hydrolase
MVTAMRRSSRTRTVAVLAVATALASTGLAAVRTRGSTEAPDTAAARVIAAAKKHVGDRYAWGGTGPDEWDCSGLTSTMWRTAGRVADIPRVSRAQGAWAIPVPADQALPGDLVFFGSPVNHVGIYLGNGRMVDASQSRQKVVLRDVYRARHVRYGRVPRPTAPPVRGGPPATPSPTPPPSRLNPVPPLGFVSRVTAARGAIRLARAARTQVGARYARGGRAGSYDAGGLVHWAWRKSNPSRRPVPATSDGLEGIARPVRVGDIAIGDLVFYGKPAVHVGIYVGGGRMVDASRALRKVVLRPVFPSETVRFGRLLRARR